MTPEGAIYDGEVTFVAVPAKEGELGVLTQHTPLIAQLGIGPLRVESGEEAAVFAVRGGFVQVLDDQVILLATEAVHPGDIDVEALKAELEAVLEKLQHPETAEGEPGHCTGTTSSTRNSSTSAAGSRPGRRSPGRIPSRDTSFGSQGKSRNSQGAPPSTPDE